MLTSLAFIFLVGLALAAICQKLKLPRMIGMLLSGILLGPYCLHGLDESILGISPDLRQLALVIILIKAGLSLDSKDLKTIGRPALLLSFLPAVFEMTAFVLFAPMILGLSHIESAVMGAVLAAVSPAVVIPRMVQLMDEKYGTDKRIPQMILAGSSLDDVFVIVVFSTFVRMAQGGTAHVKDFLDIPVSIVLGILAGVAAGLLLSLLFEAQYVKGHMVRNSMKVILILGTSLLLLAVEEWLKGIVEVSGLLGVMSMAMVLAYRCTPRVTKRLQEKFGKLWLAAEVILFVLVGAAVDVRYMLKAGLAAILMIFVALLFRSVGVWCCLLGTNLNTKERIFCVLSYLPKATVQAAIGGVPLAMGLPCGTMVLSVAVLSILITAPLGAFSMEATYRKLLHHEEPAEKVSAPAVSD